jgi:hypothetical protein
LNNKQEKLNKLFSNLATSIQEDFYYLNLEIGQLLFNDGQLKEASEYLILSLPYFKHHDKNQLYLETLENIITALLVLENETALKYIYLYKEALPILEEGQYLLKIIAYHKTFKQPYLHLIDDLKYYRIDKKILTELLLERIALTKDENVLRDDIAYLKTIATNEDLEKLFQLELRLLYEAEEIEALKEKLDDSIISIYYQLLINIKENNFKLVQKLETEYEKNFSLLSLKEQKVLFQNLTNYYSKSDLKSRDFYQKKLKEVEKELKKPLKKVKPQLVIPKITTQAEPLKIKKEIKVKTAEAFYYFEEVFNKLKELPYATSLEDNLRETLTIINNYFNFSDLLIVLDKSYYHFKKGRLYLKDFNEEKLLKSPLGIALNNQEDHVFLTAETKYNYNIITDNLFLDGAVKQVFVYYLGKRQAIMFYQEELYPLYEEDLKLKLLSAWLGFYLKTVNSFTKKERLTEIYQSFFKNDFLTLFYLENDYLYGNDNFKKLFLTKSQLSLDSFLLKWPFHERNQLNEALTAVYQTKAPLTLTLKYLEKSYLITLFYETVIYGSLTDVTELVKELERAIIKANYGTNDDFQTLVKFKEDFSKLKGEKRTFLLVSLKEEQQLAKIYGKEEILRRLRAKMVVFKEEAIYQYDGSSFLVSLPFNDIRTVNNYLRELALKDYFLMGVLRYPVETKESAVDKILTYLSLAHHYAKLNRLPYFYFKYDLYQKDKYESELLAQILTLIEQQQLQLQFKQIINLKTNKVYAYLVDLFTESLSIKSDYYRYLAKAHNQLAFLERYLLKESFKALAEIYQKTGKYLKLALVISEDTIKERGFNAYLIGLFKTYQIPYHLIDIIVVNAHKKSYLKLTELSELGVLIGTNELQQLSLSTTKIFYYHEKINRFAKKELSFISYLKGFAVENDLKLIFTNIEDDVLIEQLRELDISYLEAGESYQKWSLAELLAFIEKL